MRNDLFLCVGDNLRLCLLLIVICSSQISAYGTLTIRYHTTVTNILGANKITIDDRRSHSGFVLHGNTVVPLDGLTSAEEDSQHEIDIRGVLEDKLLGKKVNIIEFLDMGQSRGGSVYVTDDPRRYEKEDNINLRLVRDGVAKWSGVCNVSDISPGEMEEAQRLAQAERKGIWKDSNASPTDSESLLPSVAITSSVKDVSQELSVPVTPAHTNAPPVAEKPSAVSLPSRSLCPAVLLAVGGGVCAALLLWRGLRKRKP